MEEAGGDIFRLPEVCISHVLSLTSPLDSCRSSLVSSTFRSAASDDVIWERFLPSNYPEILSRAVHPVEFSSKKELYFRLCESILIDSGDMRFALERSSGRKCYMLRAPTLRVFWGDDDWYRRWASMTESRFPGVAGIAELLALGWLHYNGKIDCIMLSPRTNYAAYLIFKFSNNSYGLIFPPQKTSVKLGGHISNRTICLQPDQSPDRNETPEYHWSWFFRHQETEEIEEVPRARGDGWMEVEMGEFINDEGDDGEVDLSFTHVIGMHSKNGLIIHGIEVRPKK